MYLYVFPLCLRVHVDLIQPLPVRNDNKHSLSVSGGETLTIIIRPHCIVDYCYTTHMERGLS